MATEVMTPLNHKIKVVIVDDALVVRGFYTRILEAGPSIEITASLINGQQVVDYFSAYKSKVDVIILDIEMPVMDGMTALEKLRQIDAGIPIIIASSVTQKNAEMCVVALEAGASDYLLKPSSVLDLSRSDHFKQQLLLKVKELGGLKYSKRHSLGQGGSAQHAKKNISEVAETKPLKVCTQNIRPKAIAIAASTGGVQAIGKLLNKIGDRVKQPIFITQHMPAIFTKIMAEHLSKSSGKECVEAVDGDIIQPEKVYIAPGGYHMKIKEGTGGLVVALSADKGEHSCCPSADVMIESLVKIYSQELLVVVLSGMGIDALKGCKMVAEKGGNIIVQDKESSIVWGMPGAVAAEGLAAEVLPVDAMQDRIVDLAFIAE